MMQAKAKNIMNICRIAFAGHVLDPVLVMDLFPSFLDSFGIRYGKCTYLWRFIAFQSS